MAIYQRETDWHGCYKGETSKDAMLFTPESVAHPAKMSNRLLDRIIGTMQEFGWLKRGDTLVDPFGGTGRTALWWCALYPENRAATIEIEPHFVAMQEANKAHAERKLGRALPWTIIQGDSRKADALLTEAGCALTSPPYGDCPVTDYRAASGGLGKQYRLGNNPGGSKNNNAVGYGQSEGQIGALPDPIAITSPPYEDTPLTGQRNFKSRHASKQNRPEGRDNPREGYSGVTSPPYATAFAIEHNGKKGGKRGTTPSEPGAFVKYGNEEGQIEGLPDPIDDRAAITSPPYEAQSGGHPIAAEGPLSDPRLHDRHAASKINPNTGYADNEHGQIGTTEGQTYSSACFEVYAACARAGIRYLAIVTKDPTRDGKLRRIGKLTCRLLRAAGYRVVAWRRAWLFETEAQMEARGAHTPGMFEEFDIPGRVRGRISFFKRLHLAKGRVAAQWEDVFFAVLDSGDGASVMSPPYEGDQPCQSQSKAIKEHGYEGLKRGNHKRDKRLARQVAEVR